MELIADTSFLVGLWRRQAWAISYATRNRTKSLVLPWIVLGEFWHRSLRAGHDPEIVQQFLDVGRPFYDSTHVVHAYAGLCATLQGNSIYTQIGQNDLWIAATALSLQLPLLTRNQRHFDQIEGLRVEVLET